MTSRWLVAALIVTLGIFALSLWPDISPTFHMLPGTAQTSRSGYAHGQVVFSSQAVHVLIPLTKALQEKGLGGRSALSDHEGMLWVYPSPVNPTFWMHGMIIPLDFIWLNRGIVVDITKNVPPPATANAQPEILQPGAYVDGVLEVPAGFADRYQIAIGSQAEITQK